MTYADMLTGDGQMVLIGLTTAPFTVPGGPFVLSQKSMRGSLISGTQRTQVGPRLRRIMLASSSNGWIALATSLDAV